MVHYIALRCAHSKCVRHDAPALAAAAHGAQTHLDARATLGGDGTLGDCRLPSSILGFKLAQHLHDLEQGFPRVQVCAPSSGPPSVSQEEASR